MEIKRTNSNSYDYAGNCRITKNSRKERSISHDRDRQNGNKYNKRDLYSIIDPKNQQVYAYSQNHRANRSRRPSSITGPITMPSSSVAKPFLSPQNSLDKKNFIVVVR